MKVFVVILNWNQPELTIDCVRSVYKNKLKGFKVEIVVVDNGSSFDNYAKLKESLKEENVKIIETGVNLGFAGGNNVGFDYSLDHLADYILVLNNDTIVDSQLLTNLIKTAEEDKKVAIVSPKIYFAKGYEFHKEKYTKTQLGRVLWYAGGKMDWKNIYGNNRGVDEVDLGQYNKKKEIDFATGACFLVRASALKEIGVFNEKYFMYLEDADLSMRLQKKGWRIVYEPKAKLWHKVAQSSSIGSDLNDYFISRNRLLFGFKYANFRAKFALFRESLKLFIFGRHWQAVGIRDFYLRKFGKGSWV